MGCTDITKIPQINVSFKGKISKTFTSNKILGQSIFINCYVYEPGEIIQHNCTIQTFPLLATNKTK